MIAFFLGAALAASAPGGELPAWTVCFYGASDNDSERSFVPDMADMLASMPPGGEVQALLLVDRSPRYWSEPGPFGEDFADTRLFHAVGGELRRLDAAGLGPAGGERDAEGAWEADTGAAETLGAFLEYAKREHPARHTALVVYSHGGGYSLCPDETSGDRLWSAELTDAIAEDAGVDLLVLDVCSMAAVENAYQWRPGNGGFSARFLVATPNAGFPFPWDRVFGRIRADGGEGAVAPAALDPEAFGRLVLEEKLGRVSEEIEHLPELAPALRNEAMALLDLSRAAAVKEALDRLAVRLAAADTKAVVEAVRGEEGFPGAMNYFVEGEDGWLRQPYVDLFDLAERLALSAELDPATCEAAGDVARAVDALVVDSFGMDRYEGFQSGRNGVHVTFPDGDAERPGGTIWSQLRWYGPERLEEPGAYGNYAWCRDGATPGNGVVENWFELLDAWFDAQDDDGGANGYRY